LTAALLKALPAALAGIIGVVAAWLAFQQPLLGVLAGIALAGVAIYGWRGRSSGKALLRGPDRQPVGALPLLERWVAYVIAIGGLASGALILVAFFLAKLTPQGTDEDVKQLITAAIGVVSTLITASVVKGLDDFGALTSDPIESDFQEAYKGCFEPDSNEWRAIYDDNFGGKEGWGSPEARRARAAAVAGKPCKPAAPAAPPVAAGEVSPEPAD
jgi:hypothetical protein